MSAESGEPSGEYAVRCVPSSAHAASSASCRSFGCSSHWFTAGKILACALIAASLFADQLDTPIERTLPAACSASIAPHVSSMVGAGESPVQLVATGQWMRYRSSCERRVSRRAEAGVAVCRPQPAQGQQDQGTECAQRGLGIEKPAAAHVVKVQVFERLRARSRHVAGTVEVVPELGGDPCATRGSPQPLSGFAAACVRC
eukprot:2086428-Prymnesium_polylepis.1